MKDTHFAAPKAPQQAAPALAALFREALAWGMTYGPAIPAHKWDEMRESMLAQYVSRAAPEAPQQAAAAEPLIRQMLEALEEICPYYPGDDKTKAAAITAARAWLNENGGQP